MGGMKLKITKLIIAPFIVVFADGKGSGGFAGYMWDGGERTSFW